MEAFFYVHYGPRAACGNFVLLGQILIADGIWSRLSNQILAFLKYELPKFPRQVQGNSRYAYTRFMMYPDYVDWLKTKAKRT